MAAESAYHADDLGFHVALGESCRLTGAAHRLKTAARFETAQKPAAILHRQHFFFRQVAMEVEAVEMKLLRNENFFVSEIGRREKSVEPPIAPRDRSVNANAPPVQAEQRICPNALRCEPAKAEVENPKIRGGGVSGCRSAHPLSF